MSEQESTRQDNPDDELRLEVTPLAASSRGAAGEPQRLRPGGRRPWRVLFAAGYQPGLTLRTG